MTGSTVVDNGGSWTITRVLWFAYIALTPVYLGRSGQLQIADAALLLLGLAHLAAASRSGVVTIPTRSRLVVAILTGLVVWTTLVNLGWVLAGGPVQMLQFSAFYAYGLFLVLAVSVLWTQHGVKLLSTTVTATAFSLAVLAIVVARYGGPRAVGTFNDPNQLGYYAVLSLTLLEAARRAGAPPPRSVAVAMWALSAYLIYRSASVSALLALAVMAVVVWGGLRDRGRAALVAAGMVVLVLLATGGLPVSERQDFLASRIETYASPASEEGVRSLARRGYDRVWLYPEHMLVGAGEGWIDRFDRSALDLELHSTTGTMLFSYGIVGFGLVFGLVLALRRSAGPGALLVLAPVLTYSMFHHGFRFRMLWVLVAIFACIQLRAPRSSGASPVPADRPTAGVRSLDEIGLVE